MVDESTNPNPTSPVTPINQCTWGTCRGRIRLFSLTVQERKARRIGKSWVGRCDRCGHEVIVNPDAWRRFWKEWQESKDKRQTKAAGNQQRLKFD